MDEQKQKEQLIVSTLIRILGSPKQENHEQEELEFNCPSQICKNDHNKYNLGFNAKNNVFQCWKCKYRGTIHKIVSDYGTKEEKQRIDLLIPKSKKTSVDTTTSETQPKNLTCKIPYGFKKLIWENKTPLYKEAIKYLEDRKVDKKKIEKYNLGYIEDGYYGGRIIVPSYNLKGENNYFVGRAFVSGVEPTYLGISKNKIKKSDIIFNESNVNFDLPVYLVEGVFDMFQLPNAVPMLGKFPSKPLIEKLVKHKSKVIICLDEDALRDSIELYNMFLAYGLDVYFVEVKQDIAKYYEENGKEALIKLIKNFRKIDLQYLINLSMKDKKISKFKYNNDEFVKKEWEELKKTFEKLSKE